MMDILQKMEEDIRLRELSELTLKGYLRETRRYLDFLGCTPIETTSAVDIRRYQNYLRDECHLNPSTINGYISAVTFLYEVTLDRQLNKKQVPRCKKYKRLPVILSRSELARLFEATTNLKHRAILSLGYGSGLRASEVCKLKAEDIDSEKMRIFVRNSKGKKDRYTVLSKTSLRYLREYWKKYRPSHPEGLIFTSKGHTAGITRAVCSYALKSALAKIGTPKKCSYHTLRHCFASYMLEDGASLLAVKELLGHNSLSSTAHYLHLIDVSKDLSCPIDREGGL
jgi:site-specific recombinase XerD